MLADLEPVDLPVMVSKRSDPQFLRGNLLFE